MYSTDSNIFCFTLKKITKGFKNDEFSICSVFILFITQTQVISIEQM